MHKKILSYSHLIIRIGNTIIAIKIQFFQNFSKLFFDLSTLIWGLRKCLEQNSLLTSWAAISLIDFWIVLIQIVFLKDCAK